MGDEEEAVRTVRRLLLSGDNMLKNRTGPERIGRARERFARAGDVAREAGLDDLASAADRRLAALDALSTGSL